MVYGKRVVDLMAVGEPAPFDTVPTAEQFAKNYGLHWGPTSLCASNPCQNGGVCIEGVQDPDNVHECDVYWCDCFGYTGDQCQFCAIHAYEQEVQQEDPYIVGYWRLGEKSGTVAVDSKSNRKLQPYKPVYKDLAPGTYVGMSLLRFPPTMRPLLTGMR